MAHKTVYNTATGIIKTTATGEINFDEFKEIISEKTDLAKEHNCLLWLNDYCNAKPNISSMQTYQLSSFIEEAADKLSVIPCTIKRAIIISPDTEKNYSFAKTVADNRGIILEIFKNTEEAIKWLNTSD